MSFYGNCKDTTIDTHIRSMIAGRHWSYNEQHQNVVLNWLKVASKCSKCKHAIKLLYG